MHLAILNAVSPAEETTLNATELDNFQTFFQLASPPFTFVEYRITEGHFPSSPAACDAYLITGSPQGVYDKDPWIVRLGDFIRDCYGAGKKMVGICFGHQILAHALGGYAEKSNKGWGMGLRSFEILTTQPWMAPPWTMAAPLSTLAAPPSRGMLYFCHQDQVVKLPAGAERIAGDEFCPNTIFTLGNQVLGIQGHPEFTRVYMASLIAWLRPHVDPEVAAKATASMTTGQPDAATVAQWIVNFLNV